MKTDKNFAKDNIANHIQDLKKDICRKGNEEDDEEEK